MSVSLQNVLQEHNYDSLTNFVSMCDKYSVSTEPFIQFYNHYLPRIYRNNSTCVGLAYELMIRWKNNKDETYDFGDSAFLMSCEETVKDLKNYVDRNPVVQNTDKDHVLVGVRVYIDGRFGVIIADPGYHVDRCITVMVDEEYPHSGWQVYEYEPENYKEIHYTFSKTNFNYIEWHEIRTKYGEVESDISLIYIGQVFANAVRVTERRNLVKPLKSILTRWPDGNIKAGLYFKIREGNNNFVLITEYQGYSYYTRLDFDMFRNPDSIPLQVLAYVDICNFQIKFPPGKLFTMLFKLAHILADEEFVREVLRVNQYLNAYNKYRPRIIRVTDTMIDAANRADIPTP